MEENNKLDLIIKKLEDLEERIKKIENNCDRMDSHISFIERVYTSFKSYFGYIITFTPDDTETIDLIK